MARDEDGRTLVSEFCGIVIAMYQTDRAPPHFHASYERDEALIAIDSTQHRSELRANCERARQGLSLERRSAGASGGRHQAGRAHAPRPVHAHLPECLLEVLDMGSPWAADLGRPLSHGFWRPYRADSTPQSAIASATIAAPTVQATPRLSSTTPASSARVSSPP